MQSSCVESNEKSIDSEFLEKRTPHKCVQAHLLTRPQRHSQEEITNDLPNCSPKPRTRKRLAASRGLPKSVEKPQGFITAPARMASGHAFLGERILMLEPSIRDKPVRRGRGTGIRALPPPAARYPISMRRPTPPSRDRELVQIVDAALADAARRSGKWLACHPGCTQCCIGPFPINQLDAARLRQGLCDLEKESPERAAAVRQRARESVSRLSPEFPGDPNTGLLDEGPLAERQFADFANDEPCPALDPHTGLCELYDARPMTCRVFGPPVRSEDGLGVCELCFQGADDDEIAACEMVPDPDDLESLLLENIAKKSGVRGHTIVAFCLAS
jgi:Fe-S-cluster containining protein